MFEASIPKVKLGGLLPLAIIDNAAYEFYRLAPPGVMAVMIPVGLSEFSAKDVERVFEPLDSLLDQLMDRGVNLVAQHGVPLPILIGVEAHDRMMDHMTKHTGVPSSSTVLAVARGARDLGLKKLVVVNKWSDAMNAELGRFFEREGVAVTGKTVEELAPSEFVKLSSKDNMQLAYDLGRRAFAEHPDCDAIYIGGGAWIVEPVAVELEKQFGKPVICNQPAMIRDQLKILNAWTPRQGFSRLLGLA